MIKGEFMQSPVTIMTKKAFSVVAWLIRFWQKNIFTFSINSLFCWF